MWLACTAGAYAASYTTYIGDAFPFQTTAMAADAKGNTYITGNRTIIVSTPANVTDVFVSKLDAAGNLTQFATFGGNLAWTAAPRRSSSKSTPQGPA
ncbi:MAG TPA: hypothetical protein VKR61_09775 [Bryobacteraceae bacterium]|nr:hypothetical protein [Bryobacteraceae bacterium]